MAAPSVLERKEELSAEMQAKINSIKAKLVPGEYEEGARGCVTASLQLSAAVGAGHTVKKNDKDRLLIICKDCAYRIVGSKKTGKVCLLMLRMVLDAQTLTHFTPHMCSE